MTIGYPNESLVRRWAALLSRSNELELRAELDEQRLELRAISAARRAVGPPRRFHLQVVPGAEAGPPCPCCGRTLRQDRALVACGVCLSVWHQDCAAAEERCPADDCRASPR